MIRSLHVQLKAMFIRKEYVCAAFFTAAFACISFCLCLSDCRGTDLALIKDANQMVCFSQVNRLWLFFYYIYPFLAVLPAAASYIDDFENGLLPAYLSRTSRKDYYVSKVAACFIGTALVMFVPFLINLLFCNLFFPHNANTWYGEYQMGNYYRQLLGMNLLYRTDHTVTPLLRLLLFCPFLYNLVFLLFFSAFTGLLGALIMSVSFMFRIKRILLFIPLFLLFRAADTFDVCIFNAALSGNAVYKNYKIMDYITPNLFHGQDYRTFLLFTCVIAAAIMGFTAYGIKQDL